MNPLMQYQQVGQQTDVMEANPHRLIQLLMSAVIERLNMAKGCMERGDFSNKARLINNLLAIIGTLRSYLDHDADTDLCARLDSLYEYMEFTLFEASAQNDCAKIDEVSALMRNIKEAWDSIGEGGVSTLEKVGAAL